MELEDILEITIETEEKEDKEEVEKQGRCEIQKIYLIEKIRNWRK